MDSKIFRPGWESNPQPMALQSSIHPTYQDENPTSHVIPARQSQSIGIKQN